MREAKNAAALQAGPSLEQIHAAAALVAISGEVGVAEDAEDAEFRHLRCAAEMGRVDSNVSRRRRREHARRRERCARNDGER
jgi:hypothetical protein